MSIEKHMESLPITKYDFAKQFREHGTMAVIARRGSGKSVFLIDLLYHLRNRFDFGIAFTTTTPMAQELAKYMPRACIFQDFNVDRIKTLMDQQEIFIARGKPRNMFLLLDDCGFDTKSLNSLPMKELFMNGRHKRITFMCALQSPYSLKPDMRQQIDTVVALREYQIANRRRLYEAFFGVVSSWHDFERLFTAFTDDYSALIVDQTKQTPDLTKVLFHYKAIQNPEPFVCISKAYIKIWEQVKKSQTEVNRLREHKVEEERKRKFAEGARQRGEKIRQQHTAIPANNGDPNARIVQTSVK